WLREKVEKWKGGKVKQVLFKEVIRSIRLIRWQINLYHPLNLCNPLVKRKSGRVKRDTDVQCSANRGGKRLLPAGSFS
ncbi:MAG TPA: hypothetical protein PKI59_00950, partial [Candidatus Cloacimonadota bacterium]|nr:hypothetical protein [Candidatus Cloacimonadota bacterium]